jgi:histidine kinase
VDDVGTMAERLADTEARRVRLLGEVGHEMRTPLTVIDGQVEAMIDGVLPASAENLAVVAAESRRLQRLAADLSALSRAEEGRVNLDRQPANLGELVAGAVERLRPQTDDAGIELRCAPAGGVRVEVDSDRIAQVVTNLVGNAIRATPTGGLITVTCSQEGPEAVVRVCDTGEGIAAPELERVFERFYRVPDRRSTGRESGSGIGLTIARQLAEAHGGSLTAESAGKGLGATFTLRLPAGPRG